MNPQQIVRQHCDCYNPDGTCLGITFNDKLQPVRFLKAGSNCLLTEPMQRCQHFESSILPYRPEHKDSRTDARLKAEFAEGVHAYRIRTGYMAESIRLCPQCKVNKIGTGRKLCDLCKAENRRQVKAESDRKRNAESNSHSSSNSAIDSK